jgi:hypothetical protein
LFIASVTAYVLHIIFPYSYPDIMIEDETFSAARSTSTDPQQDDLGEKGKESSITQSAQIHRL